MLSTTATEPQTTSRTPTSVPYSTTNRAPTGGTMANTTPGPVTSDEGALFYIQYWLPAVLGLILVILLVALFRRRQRSEKAPSQVNPMAHTGSNGVYYSPCSDSGPLEVDPNRDGVTGDTAVGLVLNPAYEQNISGTELERSGDFFCPAMSDTPNHFKVKGRAQSPGKVDAIHGNPPALLGNFNVGFSEGNYNPVAAGTSCDLPSARGSRYEPVAVRRSGEHLPRPDAGYDNPDEFVMPGNKPAPPMHPWKSKKQQQGDGYEEPPVGDERSPGDGAHAPITYEIPEISPGLPTSPNTDTSYEVASIDKAAPRNTLPKYAGVDMSNKATNQDNGEKSPGADSGYEAAIVPPGNTPSSAGAPVRYNYAYAYVSPTGCPPGMPIKANQYNVLQTPCKEDDGEYSMLNRNKGGGYQTSTTAPIIMPANVYNTINIASQK
ncbi:uncharacterized protein LOC110974365 [Acanthaster planci]|uniref:Uncharacterized protein LOC110974365 n=1 Tax=Acanthaster planci TaxID=133434 RepID=A0A8B7XN89_ACAPL|nr:uncharacterized protein LOC110974365 [Acanthaster planci]